MTNITNALKCNVCNTHRAKNHISPEEPYFATFYYYDIQYSGAKYNHFFEAVGKTRIGIHL